MPTATSMLSRNCCRATGDRQHAAVRPGQIAGEEVQPDQLHAGVADGSHERVDLGVAGHRLVRPGPPELDGVESGRLRGGGRSRSGRSVNSIEQLAR